MSRWSKVLAAQFVSESRTVFWLGIAAAVTLLASIALFVAGSDKAMGMSMVNCVVLILLSRSIRKHKMTDIDTPSG
jgi:hypothetical protein